MDLIRHELRKNSTNEMQRYKQKLLHKCWEYLYTNFHKFDQRIKVHVALELVKKQLEPDEGIKPNVVVQIFHADPIRNQSSNPTPAIPTK
jgi:hypothetical protein